MTSHLTAVQQAWAQRAHDFADEYLEPIAADLDRSKAFPKALVAQMAAQGVLGLLVPKPSGVAGGGFVAHVEVAQALSQSCPAVVSILNAHALVAHAIAYWGSEAQKATYLPALAKGERLGAVAVHETGPSLGVGPDALVYAKTPNGFVLNGAKAYVRNAGVADTYLVFASLPEAGDKNDMTAFIVDAKAPGLTIGPVVETMGLHGCPVASLAFSNVAVAADATLGGDFGGASLAEQLLSIGSVAEAAQTVGIGTAAVRHAAMYATKRVQFHHPIAALEAVQTLLADVATDCHLGWLGIRDAAQLIEDGAPFEPKAAMVKAFLGRVGAKMLIDAIQVEGGMGISETVPKHIPLSLPLARMFRDIAGTTLLDEPAAFPGRIIAASIV
jgi:alkylation response protein AidB-like acyl-CoA dehydrogenase